MKWLKWILLSSAALFVLAVAFLMLRPGLDGLGQALDVDDDGYLSASEIPPVLPRDLDKHDKNGDHHIGPTELRWYFLGELLAAKADSTPPEYQGDYQFSSLSDYLEDVRVAGDLSGLVLLIGRVDPDGQQVSTQELFRFESGDLTSRSQIAMASASKWMTVAVIALLADQGKLDLHKPLREWNADIPESHGGMNLSQMLAHVSGMVGAPNLVPTGSLSEIAATHIAEPLLAEPGAEFSYGSASMTVAASLAEQASGSGWRQLSRELLFDPLAMDDTVYANAIQSLDLGMQFAPQVAGGVHSTADDYMKFLGMLASQGLSPSGDLILQADTIKHMEMSQTLNSIDRFSPSGTLSFQYALGAWCVEWEADGQCTLLHSEGAFGTHPFLDRKTGVFGVLAMLDDGGRHRTLIQEVRTVALRTVESELGLELEIRD